MPIRKSKFEGRWRIVEMELWDPEDLNLVVPAHITFEKGGLGTLEFIAISADVDYRLVGRNGMDTIEFSWEGVQEFDRCSGRGWATLEEEKLKGMLYFHRGDESEFIATRKE
jgi:hypothetical protein